MTGSAGVPGPGPRRPIRAVLRVTAALAATVSAVGLAAVGPASAVPSQAADAADASRIVEVREVAPQRELITVYSASMRREIPLDVLRPATGTPAPVLYLLNGAGGGEDSASWANRTDYQDFFADKQVNVVTPLKGAFSYYTDWQRPDPVLGVQKWQTFLTRELPPLLDRHLTTTGANAVAGISMAGTSVLNLAIARPGLYRSAASYSGCARTSDPAGQRYIRTVVEDRGKADARNMWGPYDGPGWRANDPYLNAERLRGTALYLSSNSGAPGRDESVPAGSSADEGLALADRIVVGGGIEAITDLCTRQMADRLARLRIPATVVLHPRGTHSWGYWERELHRSWPAISRSLR